MEEERESNVIDWEGSRWALFVSLETLSHFHAGGKRGKLKGQEEKGTNLP